MPSFYRNDGFTLIELIVVIALVAVLAAVVAPNFSVGMNLKQMPEGVAKKGIVAAIVFWICFDFLTTTAGLYARAILPTLDNPVQAFPALAVVAVRQLSQRRRRNWRDRWARQRVLQQAVAGIAASKTTTDRGSPERPTTAAYPTPSPTPSASAAT